MRRKYVSFFTTVGLQNIEVCREYRTAAEESHDSIFNPYLLVGIVQYVQNIW
jgi:hypothetical protein